MNPSPLNMPKAVRTAVRKPEGGLSSISDLEVRVYVTAGHDGCHIWRGPLTPVGAPGVTDTSTGLMHDVTSRLKRVRPDSEGTVPSYFRRCRDRRCVRTNHLRPFADHRGTVATTQAAGTPEDRRMWTNEIAFARLKYRTTVNNCLLWLGPMGSWSPELPGSRPEWRRADGGRYCVREMMCKCRRMRGHFPLFAQMCENNRCVKPEHNELLGMVAKP